LTAPVSLETLYGIAVLTFACQGRLLRKSTAVKTALFVAAGILLVFWEPIAAIVGLLRLEFRYPHAVAFVLAAVAVLMQWMWPERAQPRPS
jgi:zinc transporter ZupT